jgi:hypothetical protein
MALYPDYVTSQQLKDHLRITDSADDAAVAIAVTAASRAVDRFTNRQFGLAPAAVARTYTWDKRFIEGLPAVEIDDLMTSTGLIVKLDQAGQGTYGDPILNVDPWPWNAAADGRPWTHLVFRSYATAFPTPFSQGVQATGRWGWTTVPEIVEQATLIQGGRFFVRRDSQYGIAGSPETGTELRLFSRLDPDVALMLTTVKRWWGAR